MYPFFLIPHPQPLRCAHPPPPQTDGLLLVLRTSGGGPRARERGVRALVGDPALVWETEGHPIEGNRMPGARLAMMRACMLE